ncbi:2-oxoacid:ferredoxin oxidoreductase subunit gamma [Anaerobacillus arseniciselenatis]|uniref:2-oxoacid:ferredoxin oxidoreductase subunit gamma n=1 Tax=Anaerobacillus arseniciselenatis TaxID=85682 RepID=A0A1S2LU61_9BACI|nr:2-oxoacid:acceptor oxidoreductase family protein [Anaerobacillus arseniciselenatis]OIJ15886.1 2-oxoacid:ferredoxin oxidoreductase subunit gamma [Anaerobacillus arseniciselenatis]
MMHEIVIAGFGGQGVMSMGQLLAYAGMTENKHVSWLPSYGPEQRGGTANVSVVISDEPIGSPVIQNPSVAIVLNNPSFEKFEPTVKKGGVLIVNKSIVDLKSKRNDITVIEVPTAEIASEIGSPRVAGSVILGAFIQHSKAISKKSIIESLKNVLSERKQHLIPANEEALERGASLVINGDVKKPIA